MHRRDKKKPKKAGFVIDEEIGEGTNNCVHTLTNIDGVLRIARLPDDSEENNRIVKRGLAIVHAMNADGLQNILGPSMLRELSKYQIVDKEGLLELVQGEMCNTLQEDIENEYAQYGLQHIEYLSGGDFTNESKQKLNLTDEEIRFSLFSLVWFFASAQQYLGFRHHDIKGYNIMFRRTNDEKTYSFHLKGNQGEKDRYYTFKSRVVPVVIDYDFASVDTTRDIEQRRVIGTYYACSPDSLINAICVENGQQNNKVYNEEVHDFWSIGLCMTHVMLNFEEPWTLFRVHCQDFAKNAIQIVDNATYSKTYNLFFKTDGEIKKRTEAYFEALFYACCWQSIVSFETNGNAIVVQPSSEWYMFSWARMWNGWNGVLAQDPKYQEVLEAFNALPVDLKSILRTLMNQDPGERNKHDMPATLLRSVFFKGSTKPVPNQNYTYTIQTLRILEDTSHLRHVIVKYHPWIETALCSTCADPTRRESYWCKCCNRVFCGESCQRKNH